MSLSPPVVARILAITGLWLALAAPSESRAESVMQTMPTGITATAYYGPGDANLPAVLILHGFLQTRHYLTISSMAAELEGLGYPVLVPTLSLGIDRRKQSIDCEAIHNHTLEQDVAEVDQWVRWLASRGHRRVVLIGHSSGSLELLVYAAGRPHPAVKALIATSLVDLDRKKISPALVRTAHDQVADGDRALHDYRLSFCDRYTAPAAAFLSYARWSETRILDQLRALHMPVRVIMGGNDRRMTSDWPQKLRAQGTDVKVIPGANHFFSAEQEFALYDEVIGSLERLHGSGRE